MITVDHKIGILFAIQLVASSSAWASDDSEYEFIVPNSPQVALFSESKRVVNGTMRPSQHCSDDDYHCLAVGAEVFISVPKGSIAESWDYRGTRFCLIQRGSTDGLGTYYQIYSKGDNRSCDYLSDTFSTLFVYSCRFGVRYFEEIEGQTIASRYIAADKFGFASNNCPDKPRKIDDQ